jgi:hypothetical protein
MIKTYHAEPDETFHTVRQLLLKLADEKITPREALKTFVLLRKYHPQLQPDMKSAVLEYDGDES